MVMVLVLATVSNLVLDGKTRPQRLEPGDREVLDHQVGRARTRERTR